MGTKNGKLPTSRRGHIICCHELEVDPNWGCPNNGSRNKNDNRHCFLINCNYIFPPRPRPFLFYPFWQKIQTCFMLHQRNSSFRFSGYYNFSQRPIRCHQGWKVGLFCDGHDGRTWKEFFVLYFS